MFQEIDGFVIDRLFQPFSHKFQRLTGKDNFFLTRCCCFVEGVLITLFLIQFNKNILIRPEWYQLFLISWGVAGFIVALFPLRIKKIEEETLNAIKKGYGNSERLKFPFLRSIGIIFFPFVPVACQDFFAHPFVLLPVTFLFCSLLSNYFIVCTPLPPTQGKVREWWTSLNFRLKATLIRT